VEIWGDYFLVAAKAILYTIGAVTFIFRARLFLFDVLSFLFYSNMISLSAAYLTIYLFQLSSYSILEHFIPISLFFISTISIYSLNIDSLAISDLIS